MTCFTMIMFSTLLIDAGVTEEDMLKCHLHRPSIIMAGQGTFTKGSSQHLKCHSCCPTQAIEFFLQYTALDTLIKDIPILNVHSSVKCFNKVFPLQKKCQLA